MEDKYQYNGIELNTDFGLLVNEARFRTLDAQLGRWWQIDPLAEKYAVWSGYNYTLNNPIRNIDVGGQFVLEFAGLMMGQYAIKYSRVSTTEANILDFGSAIPSLYSNVVAYGFRSMYNDPSYKNGGGKSALGDVGGDIRDETLTKSFIDPAAELLSGHGIDKGVGWGSWGLGHMIGTIPDLIGFAKRDYSELYFDELTFYGAQTVGLGKVTPDGGFSINPNLILQGLTQNKSGADSEEGKWTSVQQSTEYDLNHIKDLIKAEAERYKLNMNSPKDFETLKQKITNGAFFDNTYFQTTDSWYNYSDQ